MVDWRNCREAAEASRKEEQETQEEVGEKEQEETEGRRDSSLLTWTGDVGVTDLGAHSSPLTRLAAVLGGGLTARSG